MKPRWTRMEWWESQGPPETWPESVWQALDEALDAEDWQFRSRLARWLARLRHPRLTRVLVAALRDDEHANRRNTALQVLTAQGRAVAPVLRDLMEAPHPDVRLFAVQLARTARDPDLLPDLQKRLHDPNPNVVTAAVESIGYLGRAEAVPALRPLLTSDDPWVRYQTVQALGQIGHPDVLDLWPAWLQDPLLYLPALQTLGRFFDGRAVALALEALRRPDLAENALRGTLRWFHAAWKEPWLHRYVRQFHAWLAAAPAPPDAFDALPWSAWLRHGSEEVARSAEFWACALQRPEYLTDLPERLNQPLESERARSVLTWLPPQTPEAWLAVWHRLETPEALHAWLDTQMAALTDAAVRAAVLQRWDRLNPEAQVLALRVVLHRADGVETWTWLEHAWASQSPELQDSIRAWLTKARDDPDRTAEFLRRTAAWTDDAAAWRRAAAVDVRSVLDPAGFREKAVSWMHDPDPWVRRRVLEGAVGPDAPPLSPDVAYGLLRMALTDEDATVRERAIQAYPADAPDLIEVLRAALAGPDLWVQAAAVRRLAESGHPSAPPTLTALYAHAEFPLRLEILRHVGRVDAPEVLAFYRQEYERRDLIHRRMIFEGMAHMHRHADAVFEFGLQQFDPRADDSLKVRILTTMARLAPQRFDAWAAAAAPYIEEWLTPAEWMVVLVHLDLPDVPAWARPWMYLEETWPGWVEVCEVRPGWRSAVLQAGPYRLGQWVTFLTGESPLAD